MRQISEPKAWKRSTKKCLPPWTVKFCPEQAEKLRIIRSHMDSLELCKLNESAGKKKTTRIGRAGDYIRSNDPPTHRTVSVDEAIFILQRQGYLVTPATS